MNSPNFNGRSKQAAIGKRGSVYVENFKAYGSPGQYFPVSTINLVFGPNSSGKSSFFQALQLIGDYVYRDPERRVMPPRPFSALVHAGDDTQEIRLGLLYTERPSNDLADRPFPHYVFRRDNATNEPQLDRIEVMLEGKRACLLRPTEKHREIALVKVEPGCAMLTSFIADECGIDDDFEMLRLFEVLNQILSSGNVRSGISSGLFKFDAEKFSALPDRFRECLDSFFRMIEFHVKKPYWLFTSNLPHVASIRSIPTREELLALSDDKSDWVQDCQKFVWKALLRNPSELAESRFLNPVNRWMGPEGVDLGYKLIQRVSASEGEGTPARRYFVLQDYRNPALANVDLDLADVGAGIAQVIPVLGACCMHNDLWVFIEQPELHLHPKAQAELGDVFARKIRHLPEEIMNMNNTFFLETHSEHLMLRLQKHVRKGNLFRDELTVVFTEPTSHGTILHHLRLDEDGDFIDDWPGGFFNERLREFED